MLTVNRRCQRVAGQETLHRVWKGNDKGNARGTAKGKGKREKGNASRHVVGVVKGFDRAPLTVAAANQRCGRHGNYPSSRPPANLGSTE